MQRVPDPDPFGHLAESAPRLVLAWRRPGLEAGLVSELEFPTAVRARVEWGRHYPVTRDLGQVPGGEGVYALFKNGRLFYYGSSKEDVRVRMQKRLAEARQLGVDLRRALRGLTVRVGRVKALPKSGHGTTTGDLVKAVERVLIRHGLKPYRGQAARRLRNADALTRPFTVGAGGIEVRHVGKRRPGGGRQRAPRFLRAATMKRKTGLTMEREGWPLILDR